MEAKQQPIGPKPDTSNLPIKLPPTDIRSRLQSIDYADNLQGYNDALILLRKDMEQMPSAVIEPYLQQIMATVILSYDEKCKRENKALLSLLVVKCGHFETFDTLLSI